MSTDRHTARAVTVPIVAHAHKRASDLNVDGPLHGNSYYSWLEIKAKKKQLSHEYSPPTLVYA